jgi:predicted nucleotidyltransferase
MMEDWFKDRLILKVYRGSIAYGLNTESSDIDIGGIFIPALNYLIGLKGYDKDNEHCVTKHYINFPGYHNKPADAAFYALRKFVYLATQCNPNIIETLYTPPDSIININKFGKELIKNRDLFLSKRAKKTFGNYASDQLKLMDNKSNHDSHGKHQQLIDKYGFDPKNAEHLIRLLRMAIEILSGEGCNVRRTEDRGHLLNIKNGMYSLKEVKKEANRMFKYLEEAYEMSELPDEPDQEKINKLLVDLTIQAGFEWGDIKAPLN